MSDPDLNEARRRLQEAEGSLAYHLDMFGDKLAERQGYVGLSGFEAIRYYLMQKHHWLPRDVAALSYLEMRFALHEEMQGWTVPKGSF